MIVSARRRLAARRPGFTLLEVLVVVAILVILAGVAGVAVFGYLDNAKVDTARTQCDFFEKQCKAFFVRNNRLPQGLQELVQPQDGSRPLVDGGLSALQDPWGAGQYILEDSGSVDPVTGQPDFFVFCYQNGNQNQMVYSTSRMKMMNAQQ
jgi:prepilin-type N-terminal cleavage/methylation domain-containing protein